jgi:hypothetical protein
MDQDAWSRDKQELNSLVIELRTIDRWNRLFGDRECDSDSYIAREHRRQELIQKIDTLAERIRNTSRKL